MTIPNKEKQYCVYMHVAPSGKRYIGITCQKPENRWKNGYGYVNNKYFSNAIQKYGWDNFEHVILHNKLNKAEAEEKEVELISYYQSNNPDFGYNIENGGNGPAKITDEIRNKIRVAKTGVPRRAFSDTTKEKIRISKLGENNPMYGKHPMVSNETKEKLRLTKIGDLNPWFGKYGINNPTSRPIVQCDINWNVINFFGSLNEAEKETGINRSNINAVCLGKPSNNGYVRHTAGGYRWRYATKEEIENAKSVSV